MALFSPHARVLAEHTTGRAVMDVDSVLVNYARGFVVHIEFKWWTEGVMNPSQLATIQMIADVWSQAGQIHRMYHDTNSVQTHELRWRGYYIFRAGQDDELTNDHPWQLLVIKGSGIVSEYSGDDGAVKALSDIARGQL